MWETPACGSAPRSGAAVPRAVHRGPPRQHSASSGYSGSVARNSAAARLSPRASHDPHSHFLGHIGLPELLLHHGGGGARAAARGAGAWASAVGAASARSAPCRHRRSGDTSTERASTGTLLPCALSAQRRNCSPSSGGTSRASPAHRLHIGRHDGAEPSSALSHPSLSTHMNEAPSQPSLAEAEEAQLPEPQAAPQPDCTATFSPWL